MTTTQKIEAALADANGTRKVRRLELDAVLMAVEQVQGGTRWLTVSGGRVRRGYGYQAWTTVAVVARHSDGRIGIGIAEMTARSNNVGLAWEALSQIQAATPEQAQQQIDAWFEYAIEITE